MLNSDEIMIGLHVCVKESDIEGFFLSNNPYFKIIAPLMNNKLETFVIQMNEIKPYIGKEIL